MDEQAIEVESNVKHVPYHLHGCVVSPKHYDCVFAYSHTDIYDGL